MQGEPIEQDMRLATCIWATLFAMAVAVFFVWARLPRRPDDVEAYLLPAAFLLLAAWGQIMRLQALLDQHDREALRSMGKPASNGGVSEFNKMFDKGARSARKGKP